MDGYALFLIVVFTILGAAMLSVPVAAALLLEVAFKRVRGTQAKQTSQRSSRGLRIATHTCAALLAALTALILIGQDPDGKVEVEGLSLMILLLNALVTLILQGFAWFQGRGKGPDANRPHLLSFQYYAAFNCVALTNLIANSELFS